MQVVALENGKRHRRKVRSYLSEILDIVNGTGRRISAVCALRYENLKLNEGKHGNIHWPGETDKEGRDWHCPISPEVRAAIDRVLAERPGIGAAYLFPSPRHPSKPVTKDYVSKWLRAAEKLAELEPLKGSLWHAYRRKWVTERKHLPDADVAKAGGWSGTDAMLASYQHADEETLYEVVANPKRLREAK